jgi:hypothetical protein
VSDTGIIFLAGSVGVSVGLLISALLTKRSETSDLTGGLSFTFPKDCLTVSEFNESHVQLTIANKPVFFAMPTDERKKDLHAFVVVPVRNGAYRFPSDFDEMVIKSGNESIGKGGYYCANDGKR